jgi:hypothetical protein
MIAEVWATIYQDGTSCVSIFPSDTADVCVLLADGDHSFITSITGNDWDDCLEKYRQQTDRINLLVSLIPPKPKK